MKLIALLTILLFSLVSCAPPASYIQTTQYTTPPTIQKTTSAKSVIVEAPAPVVLAPSRTVVVRRDYYRPLYVSPTWCPRTSFVDPYPWLSSRGPCYRFPTYRVWHGGCIR